MPTRIFRRFILAAAAALTCTAALAQNTIHIPADQPTIQAGINAANNGDTVLVAPGTYYENIDFLGKAITVTSSGGAAKTIIDGRGTAPAVTFRTMEPRTAVLSNFTITHGGSLVAGGSLASSNAGIYLSQSRPTILNNIITQNYCQNIRAFYSGPLIQGNVVSYSLNPEKCVVDETGGINLAGDYSDLSTFPQISPTPAYITGNTIENNTTGQVGDGGGDGGAGIAVGIGTPIIVGNIIRNNLTKTGSGAGIYIVQTGTFSIVQNLIYGNSAGCDGGAITLSGSGGQSSGFSGLVANNTIVNNTNFNGEVSYSGCRLSAQISGGGIQSLVINNIIAGNTSYPQFDCGTHGQGFGPLELQQPVFDHNLFLNSGGTFFDPTCFDVSAKYGNLSADPQFVDATNNNYQLKITSPAIDAGNNSALAILKNQRGIILKQDFDSNPRQQDATGKSYPIVDMGAYEYAGLVDADATTIVLTSSTSVTGGASTTYVLTANLASALGTPTGSVTFFLDGNQIGTSSIKIGGVATITNFLLTPGVHNLYATYPGQGGFTPATSEVLILNLGPYLTKLSMSSSPNPSIFGQPVTFAITSSSDDPTFIPSPIVLTDYTAPGTLATLLPDSAGIATYATPTLSVGSHIIEATYFADATHAGGVAIVDQQVSGYPTSTALTSSLNPAFTKQSVTFTATLTSTYGIPTGTVQFSDSTTLFGFPVPLGPPQPISPSGIATFTTSTLSPDAYTITATYLPTGNFAASSATLTQVVQSGYPTTTTLLSSLNPSTLNQSVTFSTHVTSTNGTPTGTVTFTDGANPLSSPQALDPSGNAAITTATLTAGTHIITATYTPTGTFAASSASLTQTVKGLPDTVILTATPTTGYVGVTSIALTATVAATVLGTAIPTGTIALYNGATQLGTASLINGVASLTTTTLPLGTDQLTAVYLGDTTYTQTTSNIVAVTITASPTALTLSTPTAPLPALTAFNLAAQLVLTNGSKAGAGDAIAFTVATLLAGPSPAIVVPTNASGAAALPTSLPPGQYLVTATFAGTTTLQASAASPITITIIANPTTTALTASPNPGIQNEPVAITATISALTGTSSPGGTITITDAASPIATLTLPTSATATPPTATITFTTSSLAPGTHTLVATYTPTASFTASQSSPLSVTILPQSFTLTLSDPTLTIQTGHHRLITVSLTSMGGLTATFTPSCGTLPIYATCTWHQTSVTLIANGTVATSVTVDTNQLPGFIASNTTSPGDIPGAPFMARSLRHGWAATAAFLFPLTLLGFNRRRNLRALLSLLILTTLAATITACGASKYPASTPPGTYTIPITATATSSGHTYTQTVNLTLIVTP